MTDCADRMTALVNMFSHDPDFARLPLPGDVRKQHKQAAPGSIGTIADVYAHYVKSARQMVNESQIIDGTVEHKDVKFPELTYSTPVRYPALEVAAETKFEDNK